MEISNKQVEQEQMVNQLFFLKGKLSVSDKNTIVTCDPQIWCFHLKKMVFLWFEYDVFYRKRTNSSLICESQVNERIFVICYKFKSHLLNFFRN